MEEVDKGESEDKFVNYKYLEDGREICGFDTIEELEAYNKGYDHGMQSCIDAINKWDGYPNNQLAFILKAKINDLKQKGII